MSNLGQVQGGFIGNWDSGAGGGSWSQRRRLMAVLRRAHRVLGVNRKELGVGSLGFGGGVRSALLSSAGPAGMIGGFAAIVALGLPSAAQAQTAVGNGTASGAQSIAIGTTATTATASGPRSVAIGNQPTAAGVDSIAQGTLASAGGQNAVAIGFQAAATQINTVYLGSRTAAGTGALAQGAIAVGTDVTASNVDAIAMGRTSVSSAQYAVAIGLNAQATGAGGAVAIGQGTVSSSVNSVAIGVQSNATSGGASALGTFSQATGGNSTAVGVGSTASNAYAWAGGYQSVASGINSLALGRLTVSDQLNSVAVGTEARAQGQQALAIGYQAAAIGSSTVAVGQGAGSGSTVANSGSVAVGVASGALVSGAQNTAMGGGIPSVMRGAGSGVSGTRNVAFGTGDGTVAYDATLDAAAGSLVTGDDNVAIGTNAGIGVASNATTSIGYNARASANNAIAMGNTAIADSADAVAIGTNSTATGGRAVAIGAGNTASGNGAVAIGDPNTATGNGAVASGLDNTATGNGSVAMGNTNMVGGGGQAVSTPGTAAQGAVGIGYQNTVVGQGSVAIGNTSSALAAGAVAFGDTAVANNAGDVALGSGSVTAVAVGTAGATINGTNYAFAGTTPTSTVSVGAAGTERTITNVAAGRINNSSTDAINGSQLNATNQAVEAVAAAAGDTDERAVKYDWTDTNGNGVVDPGEVDYTTATLAGAGGTTITNLADGAVSAASTDAINGSQLYGVSDSIVNVLGGTSIVNPDGSITGPTFVIQGNNYSTITDAFGGVDSELTNINTTLTNINSGGGIKYFHANSALADSQALGTDSVAIGPEAVANNAGDVALGSGSTTAVTVGTAGTTINGTAYSFAGGTPTSTVSVGAVGSERTITNVAAGRISDTSTDAINGSQLAATNQAVEAVAQLSGNTDERAVKYDWTDTNGDGVVDPGEVDYNRSTLAGVGGTTITNLADGAVSAASTDAINGSQLFGVSDSIVNTLGGTSIVNPDGSITGPSFVIQGNNYSTITDAFGGVDGEITNIYTSIQDLSDTVEATAVHYVDVNDGGTQGDNYNNDGATGLNAVAVGVGASATADNAIAVGTGATADSADAVAMGTNATATGGQAVSIGAGNVATGNGAVAIGDPNIATGTGAVAMGADNSAIGQGAVALGNLSNAQGQGSVALGNVSSALAAGAVALGDTAVANNAGDVALGSSSTTAAAVATTGTTINGTNYAFAGTTPSSTVSVGAVGTERTITNVAAGRIDLTSTDAINGSQLFATNQAVEAVAQLSGNTDERAVKYDWTDTNANGVVDSGEVDYNTATLAGVGGTTLTNIAAGSVNSTSTDAINGSQLYGVSDSIVNVLGGTSIVNPDGTITGPTYVVQGGNYTTVFDAFNAVDGELTGINATLTTIINGGGIRYFHANSTLADSQATGVNSVAIGPASTAAGTDAVSIGNGALASNAGDVALGSGSTTAAVVATSGTTINGTNYGFAGTAPTSTVSVGSAGAERTVTNVAAGQINATSTDAVNGSQLHATNQAVGALGDRVTNIEGDITDLTNDINSGNVGLVRQTGGSSGPITVGALTGGTSINVAGTEGDRVISGLGDGVADSDAVTVRQLAAAITNVVVSGAPFTSSNGGGGPAPVSSGTNSVAGGYGAVASGSQSSALGVNSSSTGNNSVALGYGSTDGGLDNVVSVGAVGAERQITNVAAGTRPTDAVNLSQLTTGLANNLTLANQYTDNRFAELSFDLSDARKDADSGTSAAMAVAGLPQPMNPGGAMIAGGFGVYRGETAFAVGLSKASDDGRLILKGGATISTRSSDIGANVGIGYQFDD